MKDSKFSLLLFRFTSEFTNRTYCQISPYQMWPFEPNEPSVATHFLEIPSVLSLRVVLSATQTLLILDFSKYQLKAQFFYSSTIYMLKNKRIVH